LPPAAGSKGAENENIWRKNTRGAVGVKQDGSGGRAVEIGGGSCELGARSVKSGEFSGGAGIRFVHLCAILGGYIRPEKVQNWVAAYSQLTFASNRMSIVPSERTRNFGLGASGGAPTAVQADSGGVCRPQ